ncbi:MAG: DUF4252 domain-containing protein [Fimbriimonadaceae bacterium]|nr:DUF4252 domain-containing protein [Chitinophagales bacterium]
MKKIITASVILIITSTSIFAISTNNTGEDGGVKLNLWIPGLLIKMCADIVENHVGEAEGDLVKKFGGMTICIREGDKYSDKTDKKVTRKINRLDKKNYVPLVRVNEENTTVDVRIKENKKGTIKRFVCIVDEKDETFVYVKMHCRLKPGDIAELVNKMNDGETAFKD